MNNYRNKHLLLIIIIILLATLNIRLLSEVKNNKRILNCKLNKQITKTDLLLNTLYFQLESENKKIDGNIVLNKESGERLKLSDLVSKKPKLFLRYSELQCDMCIDHSLSYLDRIADSIGRKNIVILASYKSVHDLSIFKRINKIDFPVYQIAEKGLNIPIEYYDTPYLFIADESLRVDCLHLLNKDIEELSKLFISAIPNKFSDD